MISMSVGALRRMRFSLCSLVAGVALAAIVANVVRICLTWRTERLLRAIDESPGLTDTEKRVLRGVARTKSHQPSSDLMSRLGLEFHRESIGTTPERTVCRPNCVVTWAGDVVNGEGVARKVIVLKEHDPFSDVFWARRLPREAIILLTDQRHHVLSWLPVQHEFYDVTVDLSFRNAEAWHSIALVLNGAFQRNRVLISFAHDELRVVDEQSDPCNRFGREFARMLGKAARESDEHAGHDGDGESDTLER